MYRFFQLGNSTSGIEIFRTDGCTVHDGATAKEFHTVINEFESVGGGAITRVLNPPKGLHQNGGPEILITIPPVRWT